MFSNLSSSPKKISLKKIAPVLVIIIAVVGVAFLGSRMLASAQSKSSSGSKVEVAGPKATMTLNKDFNFPLKNSAGKTLTSIKFLVESIEKRDEIIVKGTRATSVKGRTFLILTVKITSDFTQALQINSKDYFRLSVNGNKSEMLAPDINNDPVIVEPTSTKYTRLGWAINDSDTNLVVSVGEIGGTKTDIEVDFSK